MEEMLSSLEMDTLSRNRIISEIGTNLFVEAGAGSGKTTMLVRRMVAMVEAGIEISRICAITFTKAAAGEFYNRFQKMLIERSNPSLEWKDSGEPGQLPEPTEETRERCRIALQNIDLCFMGTIDAFCGMVLSEHPSEAGIPSDAAILRDEDAETIYKQQYVKICSGAYGDELKKLAVSFQLLHSNAQDVFVRGLSFIMNNRNAKFHYDEAPDVNIDRLFAEEKKTLVQAIRFMKDHPNIKYPKEQKNLNAWENIKGSYQRIRGRWSSNYTNLLYGLKELKNIRILPGAIAAMLFPDWNMYPAWNFMNLYSWVWHGILVLFPLLLLKSGAERPAIRGIWKPVLFLTAVVPLIYLFDRKFSCNYLFIHWPPEGTPLTWMARYLGVPGYLAGYAVLTAAVIATVYGIYGAFGAGRS